ncbi:MAG: T9SS type A sorting domain-containing protein [Psychroflexus sp.]
MKKITLLLAMLVGSFAMNAQNDCSSASTVTDGTYTVNSVDGTAPTTNCAGYPATTPANAGEWYAYTAGSQDVIVTVTTDFAVNEGGDTKLSILSGTCSDLTCYAENDDIAFFEQGDPNNNFLSEVEFLAEANQTYYIVFDATWSDAGFDFEVSSDTNIPDAPDAAISPDPADGSTVFLSEGTNEAGETVQQYQFTWELPDGSENASSYTFDLGVDANVDAFSTSINGNGLLLSGLELSTTYFWRVTSVNAGGNTVGSVWSFTTESTLSDNDFEMNKVLEHYYADNKLTLESDESISNVSIYNMLGQEMLSTELSNNKESINVAGFNNGMYITKVTIGDKTETFKFIKK